MIIRTTGRCVQIPFRSLLVKLYYIYISRLQYNVMIILIQSYNVRQVNTDNNMLYYYVIIYFGKQKRYNLQHFPPFWLKTKIKPGNNNSNQFGRALTILRSDRGNAGNYIIHYQMVPIRCGRCGRLARAPRFLTFSSISRSCAGRSTK